MYEKRRSHEILENKELSFGDKLIKAVREKSPDLLVFTDSDIKERERRVSVIENGIENIDLSEFLERYGIKEATIELDRTITRVDYSGDNGKESGETKVFSLDVGDHFSEDRLPSGYAYKGGAARALLLRSLGVDPTYTPRDIDVVRLDEAEPYEGADHETALYFMPEDYSTGYGVEAEDDVDRYFDTRDLTLNEVLATDDKIWVTEDCLRDSVRRVVRPTDFEKYNYDQSGDLGPKMLSKILRFYSEAINRWGDAEIAGVEDRNFEEYFIRPFWLALQLDRSFDIGVPVAEKYVDELMERHQIPDHIKNVEEVVEYFVDLMSDDSFFFRYAPVEQFRIEEELFIEELSKLPKSRGHGKSRGDK